MDGPMTVTDVSDPKQVAEAIKDSKSRESIAREGLKAMMSTEPGRAWLHKILLECDPYRSPFSSDPIVMAKNCGEANIGLKIIADMHEASPELYLLTMKENQK